MRFHGKEQHYLLGLTLEEMKIMYRSIWNDLKRQGTLGLDDEASDLLHDLQTVLQKEAIREGVDVSLHADWADWVGVDGGKCAVRRNEGNTA